MTSGYKPTGFPRGRPRKGEIRPYSPNAANQQCYREGHREHWLEKNREYQANWRANNLERAREIGRNSRRHAKLWAADMPAKAIAEHATSLNKELHNVC